MDSMDAVEIEEWISEYTIRAEEKRAYDLDNKAAAGLKNGNR